MIDSIKNDVLEIKVKRLGAELTSLKSLDGGIQYLWQSDSRYWTGQSYNLFPIIGGIPEDTFQYLGRTYHMKPHGFARKSEFELLSQEEHKLVYRLKTSQDTLTQYPFQFELFVIYQLEGNMLKHGYQVRNLNDSEMLFSIGAHPGFNCPLFPGETMEDYFILFETEETVSSRRKVDGLLNGEQLPFLSNDREVKMQHSMFYDGAKILDSLKSKWLEIRNTKNSHVIRVEFEGFPYLGIWSAANDAPFVCIEPWYGVDSTAGDPLELDKKEGLQRLPAGQNFECSYNIIIE